MQRNDKKQREKILNYFKSVKGNLLLKFMIGHILIFIGIACGEDLAIYFTSSNWTSIQVIKAWTYVPIVMGLALITISSISYIIVFKDEYLSKNSRIK